MTVTTYIKAINAALAEAMRADERVFVLGEDVAEGGPYTATAGLADEFGTERVRNTPISEAAITGVAVGAAQSGLRPVLEIMFIDFITLALDQLVNQAAKAHFMSGGQLTVPLVLRTQGGAGSRSGAQRHGAHDLRQRGFIDIVGDFGRSVGGGRLIGTDHLMAPLRQQTSARSKFYTPAVKRPAAPRIIKDCVILTKRRCP